MILHSKAIIDETMLRVKKLQEEYAQYRALVTPLRHKDGLCHAISDGKLWNFFVTLIPPIEKIDEFLSDAQTAYETGDDLTFATIDKRTKKIAGSTRFKKANLPNKRIEIGYTFLGKSWQRTRVNTEEKLLMLTHAFEMIGMNRVKFLTDYLNNNSRKAILCLGAKEEGILRNHMVMPDGRIRYILMTLEF